MTDFHFSGHPQPCHRPCEALFWLLVELAFQANHFHYYFLTNSFFKTVTAVRKGLKEIQIIFKMVLTITERWTKEFPLLSFIFHHHTSFRCPACWSPGVCWTWKCKKGIDRRQNIFESLLGLFTIRGYSLRSGYEILPVFHGWLDESLHLKKCRYAINTFL